MSKASIGVFDSGLGGLSVWREIIKLLPNESVHYLGDSMRCPYGDKSPEEVVRFAHENVQYLLDKGCKLIVVACNTATGLAIDELRETYEIPFVGMEPAIKPAASKTKSGVIGVLATENTFKGKHFHDTRSRFASQLDVLTAEGYGLVEWVEKGELMGRETEDLLQKYLQPMLDKGADQIVLGCSHYPFLFPQIEEIVKSRAEVIDPAPAVALQVQRLLQKYHLEAPDNQSPSYHFTSSGHIPILQKLLGKIVPVSIYGRARCWRHPLYS